LTIGFQCIFGSFFMYLLDEASRRTAMAVSGDAAERHVNVPLVVNSNRPPKR
jgi:hypothetical protein